MQDLVKVSQSTIGGVEVNSVNLRDVHAYLGVGRDFSSWAKDRLKRAVKGVNYIIHKVIDNPQGGRPSQNYIVTVDYCIKLLSSNRGDKTGKHVELIKYLQRFTDEEAIIITRPECQFFIKLAEALKSWNYTVKQQVMCDKYRLDAVIPELNIVIEYDENDHKNYCPKAEKVREQEILNSGYSKIIRVSDSNTNIFNIGKVLKEIPQSLPLPELGEPILLEKITLDLKVFDESYTIRFGDYPPKLVENLVKASDFFKLRGARMRLQFDSYNKRFILWNGQKGYRKCKSYKLSSECRAGRFNTCDGVFFTLGNTTEDKAEILVWAN